MWVVQPDPSPAGIVRLDGRVVIDDSGGSQRLELLLLLLLLGLLGLLGLSRLRRRVVHPLLRLRLSMSLSRAIRHFSTRKTGRGWNDEEVAQVPVGVVHADRVLRNLFRLPLLLARNVRKVSGMLLMLVLFFALSLPVVHSPIYARSGR